MRAFTSVLVAALLATGPVGCQKKDDDEAAAPAPEPDKGRAIAPVNIEDLPDTDAALSNLPALLASLGVSPYHARGHRGQDLTIAVLDNGFAGLSDSKGVRLPPDVKVEESPRPDMLPTNHGTKLAEIAYAVATGDTTYSADRPGPKILLFNANGFTNFRAAVQKVAEAKVDMVLYAQIWEYGGNADGLGFVNREVDGVLKSGALWVNAAGNLGDATYGGTVTSSPEGDVTLPHQEKYLRLSVPQSGTPVKIVLAWNDFDESKDYRTPQDLDLVLENAAHEEIAAGRLVQSGDEGTNFNDYSAHAREIVQTTLAAGIYYLRVEAVSKNFDESSRLRLTADGVGVRFLDGDGGDGIVLMPADNKDVLTIGASDVSYTSRKGGKPELDVVSKVTFEGGAMHQGTSAATALAVGALAVFQSANGKLDRDGVLKAIQRGQLGARRADCPEGRAGCSTPVLKLVDPSRL